METRVAARTNSAGAIPIKLANAMSLPGIDYADQRYYASSYGRFNSVDSGRAHADDPVSWNRYSYTGGDPVNRVDPNGTDWVIVNGGWCSTLDPSGGCYAPGYGGPGLGNGFLPGGSACNISPDIAMAMTSTSMGPMMEQVCGGMPTGNVPEHWAPPELCPLIAPVGNYNVSNADAEFAPDMVVKVDAAIALLNQEGITVTILSGYRNPARQAAVAQDPNNFKAALVSWHEVGEAIDLNIYSKKTGTWNPNAAQIIDAFMNEGLTWGGYFSGTGWDPVHFQNAPGGTAPSAAWVAACAAEHP
jgi:RHS repeat-associated protein